VSMSDWITTTVAGVALVVSIWTAAAAYLRSRRESWTANLTAYFHWNREKSRVDLSDRKIHVGYNLVLWNQGPATASDVHLEVRRPKAAAVHLASIDDDEFPLARIDRGGKYPVQFAPDLPEFLDADNHPMVRLFDVLLRWKDGNGQQEKLVPLRRGQTDL
jgi:hypothetical protein